ncbi:DUF6503 family protein [Psychroflexus sp. ALD_RP9]|uniref:DUF6503 family protein n=1 Tax=Psychroflexus sp. ALD_RP9 TaxID=2777186 RepID=UPI001A909972|nr:DUF6503 family protein [Psychroflexus sp. ALD_RP9]QSS97188.1 deoxyribose-phosphate aldolase [Psychroflexus sp. ALD_RP9]
MRQLLISFFVIILLISCQNSQNSKSVSAKEIVNQAIEFSGTSAVDNSVIEFDFRNLHYRSEATCNGMKLSRKNGDTIDVFYSGKFKRFIDSIPVEVNDSLENIYSESINSVHYFVQLPYRLKDQAVNLRRLPNQSFNNQNYYVVEVNFDQENGGQDFNDTYLYWFNKSDYSLDYLAYEFHVNGGGYRFRVAKNRQFINGTQFIDYDNYKPKSEQVELEDLLQLFHNKKLELVSEIKTENPSINSVQLKC